MRVSSGVDDGDISHGEAAREHGKNATIDCISLLGCELVCRCSERDGCLCTCVCVLVSSILDSVEFFVCVCL